MPVQLLHLTDEYFSQNRAKDKQYAYRPASVWVKASLLLEFAGGPNPLCCLGSAFATRCKPRGQERRCKREHEAEELCGAKHRLSRVSNRVSMRLLCWPAEQPRGNEETAERDTLVENS